MCGRLKADRRFSFRTEFDKHHGPFSMIKKLRVTVDGKPYEVSVEVPDDPDVVPSAPPPPSSAPAAAIPASPPPLARQDAPTASHASGAGDVPSPLAGRVISIAAKAGQEVRENDHLLTLEAMKMNTFVFAPKAGTVLEIKVAVGDAVAEGQSLARIG
jgi:glutaconyl-CoA/methylmalonyl-CoA decarboxylase subunit gamma